MRHNYLLHRSNYGSSETSFPGWDTSGETADKNSESWYMIAHNMHELWKVGDPTSAKNWWDATDLPNFTGWFQNLYDWTFPEVEVELAKTKAAVEAAYAANPKVMSNLAIQWNSWMSQSASTKKYEVYIDSENKSSAGDEPPKPIDKPIPWVPIIGGSVIALSLAYYFYIKNQ